MPYVIPPESRTKLNDHLDGNDAEVYLVVGAENETAWDNAKAVLADYLSTEPVLAEDAAEVDDLISHEGALGWPEGTEWTAANGAPVAVCFGWGSEPVFYLTKEQAEDLDTIDAAFAAAEEKTQQ